jgi:hypothetical protein
MACVELLDSRLWRMRSSRILGTYDEIEAKLADARVREILWPLCWRLVCMGWGMSQWTVELKRRRET